MTSPFLALAVDRLFARLTAVYGREFSGKFDGTTPDAVKAAWAHELRGFAGQLDCVSWALDHLPERCPNAVQFRNLCRQAPSTAVAAMLPDDGPVRGPTRAEREAMRRLSWTFGEPSRANRNWAHDLLARHAADPQSVRSGPLRMARLAIGAVRPPDPDETPLSDAEVLIAEYDGPWFAQEHEARQ